MINTRLKINIGITRLMATCIFGCMLLVQSNSSIAQDSFKISLSGDLVSVAAKNADLRQILQQLSIQSGFKLSISDSLQVQPVSVHFEKLSMQQALRRLLVNGSYAAVYDDNAVVTALYVLPPSEMQTNVDLMPNSGDIRQQAMRDALESNLIPDNIKSALLDQFGTENNKILQQSVTLQRSQAIDRVIELLEQMGSENPETMQQFRKILEPGNTSKENSGQ